MNRPAALPTCEHGIVMGNSNGKCPDCNKLHAEAYAKAQEARKLFDEWYPEKSPLRVLGENNLLFDLRKAAREVAFEAFLAGYKAGQNPQP